MENLTDAAARFVAEHGLEEWMRGRDSQLILKAEVNPAQAARLVHDYYDAVMRSLDIRRVVPILRSYGVVNPLTSWFLVVTSEPWRPDDAFSRCIAVEDPLLAHVGARPPRFERGDETGMCIWRYLPEPVKWEPLFATEPCAGIEPLFSPEGDPPDFFAIEEA